MANITDTLKEQFKDLISDDSLNQIETVFNEAVEAKAQLATEAALVKQDEDHATKVQQLLEAIDDDHTQKLNRIVEAVTENHTQKLVAVVEKYEGALANEATTYKESLINNISNYLDLYLEKTYPQDMLEEAVKNKKFEGLVLEMRKVLGVDMALAKDSIKDAIMDGKTQIDKTSTQLQEAEKLNESLSQEVNELKKSLTLENLTKSLPEEKQRYIQKVLGDKDVKFIKENFEYTLNLFDKQQDEALETITEQAKQDIEAVDAVIEEAAQEIEEEQNDNNPMFGNYMSELGKY